MFKNLTPLALHFSGSFSTENMEQQMEKSLYQPCLPSQAQSIGWGTNEDGSLITVIGSAIIATVKTSKRMLPASVIDKEVAARVLVIEEAKGYPVGRKEKAVVRENVIADLLPVSHIKEESTKVWLNHEAGFAGIDSVGSRAETIAGFMAGSITEFYVTHINTTISPASAMTGWLAGEDIEEFSLESDFNLASEGSTVKFSGVDPSRESVRLELATGKVVSMLGLSFKDRMSFRLTDKMELKRLLFADSVIESARINAEDKEEEHRADIVMNNAEFVDALRALVSCLGGMVVASHP